MTKPLVFVLPLFLLPLTVAAQEKVSLRWKWEKNKPLTYELQRSIETETAGGAHRIEMSFDLLQEVTAVAKDGTADLKITFQSVRGKVMDQHTAEFDTAKDKSPSDHPAARLLAATHGTSFTLKIDSRGKIVESSGLAAPFSEMETKLSEEDRKNLLTRIILFLHSESAAPCLLQQAVYPWLPEEPVAEAGTWILDGALPTLQKPWSVKNKWAFKELQKKPRQAILLQESLCMLNAEESDPGEVFTAPEESCRSEFAWDLSRNRLQSTHTDLTLGFHSGEQEEYVVKTTWDMLLRDDKKKK